MKFLRLSPTSSDDVIQVFNGSLPIQMCRDMFNKARVFISPHGALLTNLVFMPSGSHVVEVRPRSYRITVFHYLANVFTMNYYLVKGEGSKDADILVNMTYLENTLQHIATQISINSSSS